MRYICRTECWGFQGRRWKVGMVADVKPEQMDRVPKWFEPIDAIPVPIKEVVKPMALSQMNQPQQAKGGLLAGVQELSPEVDRRTFKPRGRPKKNG